MRENKGLDKASRINLRQPTLEKNEGQHFNMIYKSECEGHVLYRRYKNRFKYTLIVISAII